MNTLIVLSSALLFGAEYVIDVPEGTVVSNTTVNIQAVTAGDTLVKTGKGTWYCSRKIGDTRNFSKMEIREGTFENDAATSYFHVPLIEIKSGATLMQLATASFNGNGVTLQIDKGGLFVDKGSTSGPSWTGLADIKGSGTFADFRTNNSSPKYWTTNTLANFTGDFVFGQTADGTVSFGTSTDADATPDLSRFGSFTMDGGANGTGRYPEVKFQNAAPMVVTNRFGGVGQLSIAAGSVVTFSNLWLKQSSQSGFFLSGTVSNIHNRISLPTSASYFKMNDVNARYVQVGGVAYGAWPTTPSKLPSTRVKYPSSSQCSGTAKSGYGTRILEEGAEFWTEYQQPFRTVVNSGSVLVFYGGSLQAANATAEDRVSLAFDGGILRVDTDGQLYKGFSLSQPSGTRFEIGSRGMTIEATAQSDSCPSISFNYGSEMTDKDSNGPLTLRGSCTFQFYSPLDIGGTVTIEDGTVQANDKSEYYAEGAYPFGTGDLVLGPARISSSLPSGKTLNLANGPGARLRLAGAATIMPGSSSIAIGPVGSTEPSIVREKGSALIFAAESTTGGLGSGVTLRGGLKFGTNGKLPVLPLLIQNKATTHSGSSWGGEIDFLTVDADGLVSHFTDYATTLGNDPKSVVFLSANTNVSEDVSAAALTIGKDMTLTLAEGVALTVGDGTGTAPVLLNGGTFAGQGTLDFGSAEGVLAAYKYGGSVPVKIAGTGGLSVVGSSLGDVNAQGIALSGANTYSGGTCVSGYRAYAGNNAAFGTGDVWALGGQGGGGQVVVDASYTKVNQKITLANKFHLSGRGLKRGGLYGDTYQSHRTGAFWARSSAELTGAVEFAGPTRIVVEGASSELTLSGVLSGDAVEYYNFTDSITNAGTVVYAAANTYTGRTEVIRSTLVLHENATAGLGEILLDGGNLVLNVPAGGKTLSNRLRGSGTVTLGGIRNALATFTAPPTDDPFYQAEQTLDLNGRGRAINSLANFTSVTNSGTRAVHLSVLDDAEGSFTGDVSANVTLHYGKVYAPGLVLIVR